LPTLESTTLPEYSLATPDPYTFRIGVTGHRNLKDEPAVRAAVDKFISRIDSTLKNAAENPRKAGSTDNALLRYFDFWAVRATKMLWWSIPLTPKQVSPERIVPLKWRVVSALAQGADQIVAEAIMNGVHGELLPVLPFKSNVYERDFETAEEREHFHQFLNDADQPWTAWDGESPSSEERTTAYRLAGERVVRESDILIAIWDGEPSRGEGGTAEIITYAIRKEIPVYWIHADHPDSDPKLLSAGDNGSQNEGDVPDTAKGLAPHYHQLCAYYRDPAYREQECRAIYDRDLGYLAADAKTAKLDSTTMYEAIRNRFAQYAYADHLALRYQSFHLRSTIAIILFAALAVTAAATQLLAFAHENWTITINQMNWVIALGHMEWLIVFEIAFMFAAAALYRVSIRENWHEKWLYDRYLAEWLRGLMFREGLGHASAESNSIRELLPFYEGPSAWVDHVLSSDLANATPAPQPQDLTQLKHFLNIAWIESQGNWHGGNAEKKEYRQWCIHATGFSLFAIILLCAVLHLNHIGHEKSGIHLYGLPEVIAIFAVTLPAWGGALHGISHLMDYDGIAQRSKSMHVELGNLARTLDEARTMEEICETAKRAGELMAVENLEWMMTLAHRKPELHV